MARPAIISEKILSLMQDMARALPDDVQTVHVRDVIGHREVKKAEYTRKQIDSALALLVRHKKIVDMSKGNYRVIQQRTPVEGMAVPHIARSIGLSGEGIFFLQMTHLLCRRSLAPETAN